MTGGPSFVCSHLRRMLLLLALPLSVFSLVHGLICTGVNNRDYIGNSQQGSLCTRELANSCCACCSAASSAAALARSSAA